MLVLVVGAKPAHAVSTFTVNQFTDSNDRDLTDSLCDVSTAPGIQCTLRAAIQEANDTPNTVEGSDLIRFGIGGAIRVKTLSVGKPPLGSPTGNGPLPPITDPVTIDGYTQGEATPTDTSDDATENTLAQGNDAVLLIELDGTHAGGGADALVISAPNSVVRGLVINRFSGEGVVITGSGTTGVEVSGNFIGTDAAGAQDLGTAFTGNGVQISSPTNTVGGTEPADRNLISGNAAGVEITSEDATGNSVLGNYIGTDKDGAAALGNLQDGVRINPGVSQTQVGGTASGAGNVISGNSGSGLAIYGSDTQVEGNLIGTNAAGTAALGNNYGVYMDSNVGTVIGGTASGAGNVISGNRNDGIEIEDSSSVGGANRVEGNFIGTSKNGTGNLGNARDGVSITSTPRTTVGGTVAAAANTIAFNGENGVRVSFGDATGNRILRNSIFSNVGLGIDLIGPGENSFDTNLPTANDGGTADDADTGPNGLQNKPILTSAVTSGGATTIGGVLDTKPNTTYTVEFFSQGGGNEGKKFIGQKQVPTDADGRVTFTFSPAKAVAAGQKITATATGDEGTSEFSAPREVTAS